jgi:hypothetical protein
MAIGNLVRGRRGALRKLMAALLALWAVAASHSPARAQEKAAAAPRAQSQIKLAKLAAPPKIDGVMSEGEWRAAVKVELGYQIQPGDNVPASERTEVFLAYDRERLYVAFHAFDSEPGGIRARVTRRDEVFNDDYVSLYLDTYDDRRRAYVFHFNPLGIQADGIYTEASTGDLTWDGLVESKGRVTADGYVIEVAVPFKTMRFKTDKTQQWGLLLRRWIARKAERTSWQPSSRDVAGLLIQMGVMGGINDIYTGRTLDLTPAVTTSINGQRQSDPTQPAGTTFDTVNKLEPSLTAIYSVTPNLTFSAAINPDFSQVEADVPQIDVNQRFPLFYPERRPFFLEGAEIFRSAGQMTFVNTRQIIDPDWGLKFTGKVGRNTFGVLSASDRAPGLQVSPQSPNFGKNAQFNVVRYQRDLLKDSSVGAFVTDRRFGGTSNTVFAADSRLRLRPTDTVNVQLGYSRTRAADGTLLTGGASYLGYTHQGRHWRVFGADREMTAGYRSFVGFVQRTGFHSDTANIGYDFQPEKQSWYVSIRPYVVLTRLQTDAGLLDGTFAVPGVIMTLPRGIDLDISRAWQEDSFGGREYPYTFNKILYSIKTFKRVAFEGSVQLGEGVNFDPRNTLVGNRTLMSHTVSFRPSARLDVQLLYLKDGLKNPLNGRRLFNQEIIRNRIIYQFTRSNAVRAILEYDTAQRRFGTSLLYSYTPRPNTALYVGYNDQVYNGLDPLIGDRAPGLFRQRSTFFMKLSYNFRF